MRKTNWTEICCVYANNIFADNSISFIELSKVRNEIFKKYTWYKVSNCWKMHVPCWNYYTLHLAQELFETLKGPNVHKITENQRELVFTAATQTHTAKHPHTHTHTQRETAVNTSVYLFICTAFFRGQRDGRERERGGGGKQKWQTLIANEYEFVNTN